MPYKQFKRHKGRRDVGLGRNIVLCLKLYWWSCKQNWDKSLSVLLSTGPKSCVWRTAGLQCPWSSHPPVPSWTAGRAAPRVSSVQPFRPSSSTRVTQPSAVTVGARVAVRRVWLEIRAGVSGLGVPTPVLRQRGSECHPRVPHALPPSHSTHLQRVSGCREGQGGD